MGLKKSVYKLYTLPHTFRFWDRTFQMKLLQNNWVYGF